MQIAIYNTFEGDIFCRSALKPQNLEDLIALKSNLGNHQFSSLKFSIAQCFNAKFVQYCPEV